MFQAMRPEPAIFDIRDEEHDARRLAEASADVAAGRNHKAMKAWQLSWERRMNCPRRKSATENLPGVVWTPGARQGAERIRDYIGQFAPLAAQTTPASHSLDARGGENGLSEAKIAWSLLCRHFWI